jgi:hypothetical protein
MKNCFLAFNSVSVCTAIGEALVCMITYDWDMICNFLNTINAPVYFLYLYLDLHGDLMRYHAADCWVQVASMSCDDSP